MGIDHAPILCKIGLDKAFKVVFNSPKPRYNFNKLDWNKFGQLFDSIMTYVDLENISELNDMFLSAIINSADQSIPKILKYHPKISSSLELI